MMNSKNYSIQALRAIAALLVVLDHTLTQFNTYNHIDGYHGRILENIEALGLVGVYIFFIISGYIMLMTTAGKNRGLSSASTFMKKRLTRIYPTYWVWLSVLVILWIAGVALKSHEYSTYKIISSYILFPFIDGNSDNINPVLSQGWTLIYEMFFYCIFAILMITNVNNLKMIIMTLIIFLAFYCAGQNNLFLAMGLNKFFANGLFFLFPLGMLFYELKDKIHAVISSTTIVAIIHIFSIASVIYLIMRADNTFYEVAKTVCAISIFISVYILTIKNKALLLLGDASYSIYLTHTFIVMAYGIISKTGHFSPSTLLALTIPTAAASIAFGVISYITIEKKLQEITTQIFFRKKNVKSTIV